MVVHWRRVKGPGARHSMFINGLGAMATAVTVAVVLTAKFAEGAWITMLLIPAIMVLMLAVKRHYDRVAQAVACDTPLKLTAFSPPLVVVPIDHWSMISQKAMKFALNISPEVTAVHVDCGEGPDELCAVWDKYVGEPAREVGLPEPKLVTVPSPYRQIVGPILDYVLDLQNKNPDRQIAVLLPELVERRWYQYFLHNQRPAMFKAWLYLRGNQNTVVINVPWYFNPRRTP